MSAKLPGFTGTFGADELYSIAEERTSRMAHVHDEHENEYDLRTVASEPTVTFVYRNWRNEIRERRVTPIRVWFGKTDWHPVEQWFLEGVDAENGGKRDFALADILTFEPERHQRDRRSTKADPTQ